MDLRQLKVFKLYNILKGCLAPQKSARIYRSKVSLKELEDKPYLIWNGFIDIVVMVEESKLTDIQKIGKRAFNYDGEIQNGGHLQFFENSRLKDYTSVINSLIQMNAQKQAHILQRAVDVYKSKNRPRISDKYEYSKIAFEGEYDSLDTEYYKVTPTLTELMEKYAKDNVSEFIEFTI